MALLVSVMVALYLLPVRLQNTKTKCFASRLDAEHSGVITSSELAEAKKDMPKPIFDQEFLCARVTEEERSIITTAMLEKS